MNRHPPLSKAEIEARLVVDIDTGVVVWKDATKYHKNLAGEIAGGPRNSRGKPYWTIRINGIPYRRSQIVLVMATGVWPAETVDHINGDSLDDRACNLRHASITQNNWNQRRRAKEDGLPTGVRLTKGGRFQARIACHQKPLHLGIFDSADAAHRAYQEKRVELFGRFA
ncbi:HNH endonuclease [Achromobacter piechaudii]|uniref:HNH endonuclease n=1 Tax=Achromobacter piechaudii TaxID=72556 RepID=UPI001469605B|nr:HNH endonuclease [Achromobacter piechaudii]CAB3952810.1 hypothetical protein LMG6103_03569 [Achromobacter piechaudii]